MASFTSDTGGGGCRTYVEVGTFRTETRRGEREVCLRQRRRTRLAIPAPRASSGRPAVGRGGGLRNGSTDRDFNVEHTRFESIGPLLLRLREWTPGREDDMVQQIPFLCATKTHHPVLPASRHLRDSRIFLPRHTKNLKVRKFFSRFLLCFFFPYDFFLRPLILRVLRLSTIG